MEANELRKEIINLDIAAVQGSSTSFPLNLVLHEQTMFYIESSKTLVFLQGQNKTERNASRYFLSKIYGANIRIISESSFLEESGNENGPHCYRDLSYYIRNETKRAFIMGTKIVVIDSTVIDLQTVLFSLSLADEFQYALLVIPPIVFIDSSFQIPKLCCMKEYQMFIFFHPHFAACYLHESDSQALRKSAICTIREVLTAAINLVHIPQTLFHVNDALTAKHLLYCVLKIFKNGHDVSDYFTRQDVKNAYGKIMNLKIYGFVATHSVLAARVMLTDEQKQFRDISSELAKIFPIPYAPSLYVEDMRKFLKPTNIYPFQPILPETLQSGDALFSTDPLSYRKPVPPSVGYIVLYHSASANRFNVDFDAHFATLFESYHTSESQPFLYAYELPTCFVNCMNQYCYIYLKKEISVDSLFTAFCEPTFTARNVQ